MKFEIVKVEQVEVNEKKFINSVFVDRVIDFIDDIIDDALMDDLGYNIYDDIVDTELGNKIILELRKMVIQKLQEKI